MKPRQLADRQIKAMYAAAKKVWDEDSDRLDVTNIQEGKRFCWQHVKNHFSKA